jgi:hypothetical protein
MSVERNSESKRLIKYDELESINWYCWTKKDGIINVEFNLILTVSNPYKYHSFSFIFHLDHQCWINIKRFPQVFELYLNWFKQISSER